MKKTIIAVITATALLTAYAVPIATATAPNGDWVQVFDDPCNLPNVVEAMGPYGASARKAEAILNKDHFKACYVVANGMVNLMFEDGDVGQVPISAFTNKKIT